jgi:hypothetical protein
MVLRLPFRQPEQRVRVGGQRLQHIRLTSPTQIFFLVLMRRTPPNLELSDATESHSLNRLVRVLRIRAEHS